MASETRSRVAGKSLVAGVVRRMAARRLAEFDRASLQPQTTQSRVLQSLLRRARDTEWGQRHAFAEIGSPEEFRKRVPVTRYEDIAPVWQRAYAGDRNVTWPGHIRFFAMSSGTTADNKYLPVSNDAIRSNQRAGSLLLAMLARRGDAQALVRGKFFYLGGSTTLEQRGRCLVGDASGIMGRHIPFFVRRRHLPARDIAALVDWEEKSARIVERYLRADVTALSACPSWGVLLIQQLRRAAEEQGSRDVTLSDLWPKLQYFISYGMAFEPYRRILDAAIGHPVHYVDTYSSSEGGMTGIQEEDGGPLRLIVDNGVFFEFVPAEHMQDPDPPRLHIGEVAEGRDYAVLMSSNGGIWGYPLGDVIRFVSLRPPRIRFSGRTRMYLSAFGEHLTLDMLESAIAEAGQKTGALVADYTVVPRFPSDEHPKPAHRWIVEFERAPADADAFMSHIDTNLRSRNEDYAAHRAGDFGMSLPILTPVKKGTFYRWMKERGQLGAQHKVPRVLPSEEAAAGLLQCQPECAVTPK